MLELRPFATPIRTTCIGSSSQRTSLPIGRFRTHTLTESTRETCAIR